MNTPEVRLKGTISECGKILIASVFLDWMEKTKEGVAREHLPGRIRRDKAG